MMSGGSIVLLIAAGALVAGAALYSGGNPLAPIEDFMDRGRRLTTCTVDANGVVAESPAQLAAAAAGTVGRDVSEDANSLARMARSETVGDHGQIGKLYKCHVCMNQADALGWGITDLVTYHTDDARAGRYGKQITGRVASGSDPYESDLTVAEFAIDQHNRGEDPTAGALNFVDVGAFGVQAGTSTWTATRARWEADGKVFGTLPDSPAGLVFAWRGAVPAIAEALA